MKNLFIFLSVIVIFAGMAKWSANHDKEIMAAGEKYETCVRATYGMSPSAYLEQQGEYPECQ